MHDIAEFLRSHSPFDSLDEEELARVAASAEIEFHASGTPILESAEATAEFAYVVRRGSVELLIDGRLLDLLGEGEMFGFASLLEEGPLGFVARAAEDTLVYRIPSAAIHPVLERPAAVRFVAQSMNKGVRLLAGHESEPPLSAAGRPVGELIRAPALVCPRRRASKRRLAAWSKPARRAWLWTSTTGSGSSPTATYGLVWWPRARVRTPRCRT